MVSYRDLNVPSPVASALLQVGQTTAAGIISIGAIAGLTTVILVMYFGLTRVLFAIAHDGLLPKFFAYVNPKSGTPIGRSEEHTSELQSLMRTSYAVFCLKKKKKHHSNS